MEQTLTIRPVTSPEQIEVVALLADAIWNECYAELLSREQIRYMVDKFQSGHAISDQIENEGYLYYLFTIDGNNAGYIGLQPKDGRMLLSKIYLLKSYRGSGHLAMLFGFVDSVAKRHACSTVWMTANKGNERAAAAYRKMGFKVAREQVADIGQGFVMDDYVFEKPVP